MPTVEYVNYEVLDDHGWSMDDDDLFEKAADAGLDDEDYGTLEVNKGEYILEAAEAEGYDWPFSCRAGACANCAAILREGEIGSVAVEVAQADAFGAGFRHQTGGLFDVAQDKNALFLQVSPFLIGQVVVVKRGIIEQTTHQAKANRAIAAVA
jgi:ferredoxin